GRAQLQRAARLVLPDARVARRGALPGKALRRRRGGVSRRSHSKSAQWTVALRTVADAARAEERVSVGGREGLPRGVEARRRRAEPGRVLETLPRPVAGRVLHFRPA